MTEKTKRICFTLPTTLLADLGYVALRLGANKSTLVEGLLGEPLAQLRQSLFAVPGRLDQLTPEESQMLMAELAGTLDSALSQATTVREGLSHE